jgi:hypothetical protein
MNSPGAGVLRGSGEGGDGEFGARRPHVKRCAGSAPAPFPGIWTLHFRKGLASQIGEFPRWSKRILIALAAYYSFYSFHFYLFMKIAADEIRAASTWRMFSAGWMALFAAPAAYYWPLIQRRNPE